jgi:hypothetical protein
MDRRPTRLSGRVLRLLGGIATDDHRSMSVEYWTRTPVPAEASAIAASISGR